MQELPRPSLSVASAGSDWRLHHDDEYCYDEPSRNAHHGVLSPDVPMHARKGLDDSQSVPGTTGQTRYSQACSYDSHRTNSETRASSNVRRSRSFSSLHPSNIVNTDANSLPRPSRPSLERRMSRSSSRARCIHDLPEIVVNANMDASRRPSKRDGGAPTTPHPILARRNSIGDLRSRVRQTAKRTEHNGQPEITNTRSVQTLSGLIAPCTRDLSDASFDGAATNLSSEIDSASSETKSVRTAPPCPSLERSKARNAASPQSMDVSRNVSAETLCTSRSRSRSRKKRRSHKDRTKRTKSVSASAPRSRKPKSSSKSSKSMNISSQHAVMTGLAPCLQDLADMKDTQSRAIPKEDGSHHARVLPHSSTRADSSCRVVTSSTTRKKSHTDGRKSKESRPSRGRRTAESFRSSKNTLNEPVANAKQTGGSMRALRQDWRSKHGMQNSVSSLSSVQDIPTLVNETIALELAKSTLQKHEKAFEEGRKTKKSMASPSSRTVLRQ